MGEIFLSLINGPTFSVCDKIEYQENEMRERFINDITLTSLANSHAEAYILKSPDGRKEKGQFFTPPEISNFMSGLFSLPKTPSIKISLLDPGAGAGILTAGFCNAVLANNYKKVILHIDLYEKDGEVLPFLKKTIAACHLKFKDRGWDLTYKIINADFILANLNVARSQMFLEADPAKDRYDYIVSNPPYFKLNADSPETILLKDFTSGQPNIYVFFMILSLLLLKPKGQLVFITPRSFCSGLYHMKFRKWLIDRYSIENIHNFDSRKNVFYNEDILQESIIIKVRNITPFTPNQEVTVSQSNDSTFSDLTEGKFPYADIFHHEDAFIKIPANKEELAIGKILQKWNLTFQSLGMSVSTGPVVAFRAKEYLFNAPDAKEKLTPLLWMHNIQGLDVRWPLDRAGKEKYITTSGRTKNILLPAKNYILLKRFTSKEQQRRLYAGVLLGNDIKGKYIGIENHLNYIHKKNSDIPAEEAFGIAAFLNTSIVDCFFRSINGNTQVNAGDLRALPLPPLARLKEIGRQVRMRKCLPGKKLDLLVAKILDIPVNLLNLKDDNEQDKTGNTDPKRLGAPACAAK
ncbi:MAG: Eco57I restriction-modification methylase domain-containing protein [Elusimicrobia bacterium]|nr:Eco57I restriction-modification methylase domain-containing protein [Elusimicrobiota bacterium]